MLEKLFSFSNSCLKGGGGLFNIFSILGDLRNFWQNIHPWSAVCFVFSESIDAAELQSSQSSFNTILVLVLGELIF